MRATPSLARSLKFIKFKITKNLKIEKRESTIEFVPPKKEDCSFIHNRGKDLIFSFREEYFTFLGGRYRTDRTRD